MSRAIAVTALWAVALGAGLIFLQACAALQEIQRPPPPESGRNVWREMKEAGDLGP